MVIGNGIQRREMRKEKRKRKWRGREGKGYVRYGEIRKWKGKKNYGEEED